MDMNRICSEVFIAQKRARMQIPAFSCFPIYKLSAFPLYVGVDGVVCLAAGETCIEGMKNLSGEKELCVGQPNSICGILKRVEYYVHRNSLKISCHHLRQTMALQMLNADTNLSTIQYLCFFLKLPCRSIGTIKNENLFSGEILLC